LNWIDTNRYGRTEFLLELHSAMGIDAGLVEFYRGEMYRQRAAEGDVELARDLAMHVAAMNPEFVSADDVPAEVMAREKDILIAQAEGSGKPADIVEKMVEGRLRKHLSGITLLGQAFVKDGDLTVEKLLKQNNASVKGFQRIAVGEGIEKKQENFADEVMQQVTGG